MVVTLFLITFTYSCGNKQKAAATENQEEITDLESKIEYLNTKAENDSDFKKSQNYISQIEKTNIQLANEKAKAMTPERMLEKYESSIENLKSLTEKLKQNPTLANNKSFIKKMQDEASEVRECYQTIKKQSLTDSQKIKFKKLTNQ